MSRLRAQSAAALLAAAASGGAVLTLELLAAARLAPVFGSGLDVWAAVLAVTFGAMAGGYLAGSVRTARVAQPGRAAMLAAAAALATALAWVAASHVLDAATGPEASGPAALLLATSILLLPPVLLLAALGPWIVELHHAAAERGAAGRSAGLTYAASTLGGVVCALGAGFYAIPVGGLARTAGGVVALLALAAGVLGLAARGPKPAIPVAVLLLLAGVAFGLADGDERDAEVLDEAMGLFGHVVVTDDGLHRTMWVNGIPQTRTASTVGPDDDLLDAGIAIGLLPHLRPAAGRALVVGLGGGVVPRGLERAGWQVDAVEIDPRVVAFARRHFAYEGPCHVIDGRRFLLASVETFDAIVVDVYRGEQLPAHMVTREFFALAASRLAPRGVLALNLIGSAEGNDVAAVLRTVRDVFPHVALFAPADDVLVPMTLFASADPLEDPSTEDRLAAEGRARPRAVDVDRLPLGRAPLLTDDVNPIPLLRRPTARAWRDAARRRLEETR